MIKCCGANSSCLYRTPKKKPPNQAYFQNNQTISTKYKDKPKTTSLTKQISTKDGELAAKRSKV
jgi:uncharacterized lipoprotein YajG